ncbi:hypothetical protein Tsubulata_008696, partial [Turnera subulata]
MDPGGFCLKKAPNPQFFNTFAKQKQVQQAQEKAATITIYLGILVGSMSIMSIEESSQENKVSSIIHYQWHFTTLKRGDK